jgi:hypothetical protein
MSDGGKGSRPRPFSVTQEEYENRWNEIFQRDKREIEDAQAEDEAFANIPMPGTLGSAKVVLLNEMKDDASKV